MGIHYRTFINKDCDKEVFGALFSRNPYHRKVGTGGHSFFTGLLRDFVSDDVEYDHKHLALYDWTGEELYNFINTEIGDNNYMGAIEVTRTQAGLVCLYANSLITEEAEGQP